MKITQRLRGGVRWTHRGTESAATGSPWHVQFSNGTIEAELAGASRLRTEAPDKYEAYVELEPGVWTKIRIEVNGAKAQLFVHDQAQPTLIVVDVKSGPHASGGVALWVGAGTVAHFRNVRVRAAPTN